MHIGILLRINTPYGPVLMVDSDMLHHMTKYRPQDQEGWAELFPGDQMTFRGSRDITIDIKAVKLVELAEETEEIEEIGE